MEACDTVTSGFKTHRLHKCLMLKHSWEKQENPISFDTLPVNWLALGLSELRAGAISKLLELTKVVGGACNDNNATDSSVLMF